MQQFIEVVILSALLALSTAQLQPGGQTGQQEPSCMSQFDATLGPRCFDANGVSFQGLLSVITQGQNGQLPPNMTNEQLIQVACNTQTQDRIIPCVIQTTNAFTNGTTCPEQERNMIAQSSFRLTQIMGRMCLQPCELQTNDRIMRCFATLQIPTDRIMNSSMIDDKFALIGNTSAEVQRFCNNHGPLFTCLETEKAQCPAFEKTMFEMGIDFTAMKQATAILCQKQQEYLAAEKCFMDNMASTQQCMMATGRDMQALLIGRFQMGTVPPSTMTNRLCAVRLTKVPCELQTFQQACSQHVVMRNEFECNILAEPCRGIPNLQPVITNMCSSSTPPEQQITQRPPVVANNNINDFTNNNNANNNFNNNNNNNFRSANSMQGNSAGSAVISLASTVVLAVSALILH